MPTEQQWRWGDRSRGKEANSRPSSTQTSKSQTENKGRVYRLKEHQDQQYLLRTFHMKSPRNSKVYYVRCSALLTTSVNILFRLQRPCLFQSVSSTVKSGQTKHTYSSFILITSLCMECMCRNGLILI